jgi:hypothetical protein
MPEEWLPDGPWRIALLCSSVLNLVLRHICLLAPDLLAQLSEMLGPGRIPGGGCDGLGERILRGLQIAGRVIPLLQLLIGRGSVPERDRPLQAVGLYGARRQQLDLAVKGLERPLWFMRNGEQRHPIFIVSHDARQAFGGRSAFGLVQLGLAGRDGSGVVGLQQFGAIRAPRVGDANAKQDSGQDDFEKWQPRSHRIE